MAINEPALTNDFCHGFVDHNLMLFGHTYCSKERFTFWNPRAKQL